jgi:hypothetical protein
MPAGNILEDTEEKVGSGYGSVSQRYGSGSAPKCHGSPTLLSAVCFGVSLVLSCSKLQYKTEDGNNKRRDLFSSDCKTELE